MLVNTKTLLSLAIAATVCIAQNVNISGTVTDTGGTAIADAVVLLEKGGLVDTTGADGSFTLSGATGINDGVNESRPHTLSATINNGFMHLNIAEKSAVEINTYTLQGKLVSSVKKTLGAGAHSIKLPNLGAGVYMYQVKIGSERLLIKNCSISGGTSAYTHGSPTPAFTQQAMVYFPINDVIAVTKDDFLNYRVVVTNSDTSGIEIKMIISAGTVTDIDGNVYQTVQHGDQVWTVENLRTTKFNDGTTIPHIIDSATWVNDSLGSYCYYSNTTDADSIRIYGALYNWYAIDTKKLAPAGWHVPDTTEWNNIRDYLIANGYNWDGIASGNRIAKSLATQTHWNASTDTATIGKNLTMNNRSGFSAFPGGLRYTGTYLGRGMYTYWWSASESNALHACDYHLRYDLDGLYSNYVIKTRGLSVRLAKD